MPLWGLVGGECEYIQDENGNKRSWGLNFQAVERLKRVGLDA